MEVLEVLYAKDQFCERCGPARQRDPRPHERFERPHETARALVDKGTKGVGRLVHLGAVGAIARAHERFGRAAQSARTECASHRAVAECVRESVCGARLQASCKR
jgi:hypothetical protein